MLEELFRKMDDSKGPVGTSKLKDKYKWETFENDIGLDGFGLLYFILPTLEEEMKGTSVQDLIPSMFEGELLNYIRCFDVEFTKQWKEKFHALHLHNSKGVIDSLHKFIEPEIQDGEHKVRTDIHGLQEGERGVKLLTLSPILCLYSERYRKKFLEPYEFSRKLELDEFLDIPDPNDKATYVLHSLLIHRCKLDGQNSDGNYHAFIDPKCDGNWFVFDHELVEKSDEEEMLREGFGGVIDGQLYRPYFFFYIRESKINEILLG
uniref:ubiquitin carboxyl-terminal hydrolase 7-like isoform X1 n=1 Tax=Styela clava TaxID=7725 RepID=UPI0019395733|nr:ubiquitin carboxyl-terminal hydrolase 7-like isoform X1 [Styela clava]